ncbi:MAG: nicotinamide mononucleotide transporter [Alphaproteobacteria bacterium]|nr:nicotinamide mononucleotide transporter [Alphaproteobacteria bacterium]
MTTLEIAATAFGLASVWLTVRRNIWLWPTGMVMVALYSIIFYEAKLYSEVGLQVIFFILQIYGWHHWLRGEKTELPVTRLSGRQMLAGLGAVVAGAAALGYVMDTHTGAVLAYPDAFITTMSLAAQWLVGRKVLENWLCWITSDVVSVGVYLDRGLYPTAGLYATFLIMATVGYTTWKRSPRAA